MKKNELKELEEAIEEITMIARDFGLDFYDMHYEICPSEIIYTFGAYGMPTRFSHWSFGKAFHRMKVQYDFGLSKIYELVINSDPCYAFLLDSNTLLQNKLIVAHVLGHCDFFKHNARFYNTSRFMVDSMAASAERIRQYEIEYGKLAVEEFIDSALALQEHVDPALVGRNMRKGNQAQSVASPEQVDPYADLFEIGAVKEETQSQPTPRFPAEPEKDLMMFIMEHAKHLQDWQRDILSVMREEMLYFWPQLETKIMNEGWATYWHLQIMRELDLDEGETVEFAKMNAGVIMPSRTSLNPYHVGLKMWEDIEKRYGREAMWEIREVESDSSFLRNYLTKELCEEMDLYLYQKVGNEWKVVEKDWEKVRDMLCASRVNGGFPVLTAQDGDYLKNGELYLKHSFDGTELDVKYLEKTLPHVYNLWGRTIHLETVLDGRAVIFTHDGKKNHRRFQ
ncbi:stage V sporulation protein R [Tumebacillus algifaecis]|uniref:Stage V sporulation protein R n=1 Tax=Tumebacillus algifaecis TaxID=1214604 RepID=A0A223CZC3_9BACL|nr:SpoVR family protein [Tumebacillus algifaecis]ASS74483.1 stage V sporulation protein R [Tumebacillus algifaecis]